MNFGQKSKIMGLSRIDGIKSCRGGTFIPQGGTDRDISFCLLFCLNIGTQIGLFAGQIAFFYGNNGAGLVQLEI